MKRTKKTLSALFGGLALAAALAALPACESADSYSISVSPNHADLKAGQSVQLTASGWGEYSWSMETAGIGHLSRTTGDSVVYTALSLGSTTNAAEQVQRITVTAVGSGSGTSTNGTSSGYSAVAEIHQTN